MPTGLPANCIHQPFGPNYLVTEAQQIFGPESCGYIVESLRTGKFVWTGRAMTISQAFARLLEIER